MNRRRFLKTAVGAAAAAQLAPAVKLLATPECSYSVTYTTGLAPEILARQRIYNDQINVMLDMYFSPILENLKAPTPWMRTQKDEAPTL